MARGVTFLREWQVFKTTNYDLTQVYIILIQLLFKLIESFEKNTSYSEKPFLYIEIWAYLKDDEEASVQFQDLKRV